METTEIGMAIVTATSREGVAPKAQGSAVGAAMGDVLAERKRQDFKWGEQNHPIVGKAARRGFTIPKKECERLGILGADEARERCDHAHRNGEGTYTHIIIEEVAEAIEAGVEHGEASDESREEWVQVAAVALAIVECIDRKRGAK